LVIWLLVLVADGCGQSVGAKNAGSLVVVVTAGPTCPVERIADPTCAPRPVKGARLRLVGPREMTVTADASGTVRATEIPVGVYRLVADSVDGLMGTPAPLRVVIRHGAATHVAVSYDTGIR
jgi:hypothetical protein